MGLELLSGHHLPPIRTAATTTTRPAGGGDENAVVDGCATPTSAVLRPPSVCPPAPKKMKPRLVPVIDKRNKELHQVSRSRRCGLTPPVRRRYFIAVPYDVLAAAFVARPDVACRPLADEKIRLHVAG